MNEQRQRAGLRATRAVGLVALFAAVALAFTLYLRRALPRGGSGELVDVKLAVFEKRRDEFTVLFLGSSRAHRGFVPSVFDERMRELKRPARSFNFGAPGSRAFEVRRLLERIGELAPRGIDFVFIDPEGLSVLRDERNHLARQVIEWHDPRTTLRMSEFVLGLDLPPEQSFDTLLPHWQSCAYNAGNIGRAERWVDGALGRPRSDELVRELAGPALDGYAPLGEEGEELGRRGERFRTKRRETFLKDLAAFRELEVRPEPPSEFARTVFAELEASVEALGATPIFVAQPAMYHQDELVRAHELGLVQHLLRYDDPRRLPELYEPDHRYDATHLNDEGARLFTALLAADFAAALERGEIRAR